MNRKTKITYLKCSACNKDICKRKAEIDRQKRKGRTNFYCDTSCAGKHNCSHLEKYQGKFNDNLIPDNRRSEHSDFKWYIKTAKQRRECDVDVEYLKNLWEEQKKTCPFTGVVLELRTHTSSDKAHPYSASLDRIDNSKGYVKGNVRFVALMFNIARNTFTDGEVIEFCKLVAKEH